MGRADINRIDNIWLVTIFHRSCFVTKRYKALSSILTNVLADMTTLVGDKNEENRTKKR